MKKLFSVVVLGTSLILTGCGGPSSETPPDEEPQAAIDIEEAQAFDETVELASKLRSQKKPAMRTITLNAKKFEYDKPMVRIKAGENVTIKIKNLDFKHGIVIPGLNLQGTDKVVIKGAKKGEYEFFCSLYCGKGHGNMKGKLIVE